MDALATDLELAIGSQNELIQAVQNEETPARNLVLLIKQLVKEEQYEGVALLFTSEKEAVKNLQSITGEVSMEILHEVCLVHLNDGTYNENLPLYSCAEELLKALAKHAPPEELLLELLELVEEEKSEYIFTSALRALQVVLLRMGEKKPRALEWSLNSILTHLQELPMPKSLHEGYDEKEQQLLEQNEQVQSFLMHYITIGLFYEPLLKDITESVLNTEQITVFRNCGTNRRNVLCCFLIQLLGKPLSLLDLSNEEHKTNTYTIQCAHNLTQAVTQCLGDPFYLLNLVEKRLRWQKTNTKKDANRETSSSNIFLIEEKVPSDALAMFYYMVLVEGSTVQQVPKVYALLYIFQTGIYMATQLLDQNEPPALHYRGMLLAKSLLGALHAQEIPANDLALEVHKKFCDSLCSIIGYSSLKHVRQTGVPLLRQYILQFEDEGKYMILKNLLHSIGHIGISGYLATIYKDLVASALTATKPLPSSFSGQDFRTIFLQSICHLPKDAETDLIEYSDKVISALNAIRFFAIKDCHNRTGFWNLTKDIEKIYLQPLRKGLNLSIAHYKAELERVERGLIAKEDAEQIEQLNLLNIAIANEPSSGVDFNIDRERKLQILQQNLCTFDLMRSLLARVTECIESSIRLNEITPKNVEVVCGGVGGGCLNEQ